MMSPSKVLFKDAPKQRARRKHRVEHPDAPQALRPARARNPVFQPEPKLVGRVPAHVTDRDTLGACETPSLLVIGPGPQGRGGIGSVIRMHQKTAAWRRMNAQLLSTYDDRSTAHKVYSALRAYFLAPFRIMAADLVHIHLAAQISLMRKLPFVWVARVLHKPIVVHVHAATEETLFVETPRLAVRFVFQSATRVVALSQSWAALIRKHIPSAQVVVVPNPVMRYNPAAEQAAHVAGSAPVILAVGKLDARKGYRDLLAAAVEVLREFPSAQFWFAGHGEVEEARAVAMQLGIAASVRLLGWVDSQALESIYRQSSMLVLASYGEGVPMSVIEAMSHAVPVVCTPVGGVPEWVIDGQNGLLLHPGDVPALTAQILRLLREPALARSLGAAGLATVQERCTVEMVSDDLEALYAEVLRAPLRS